MAWAGHTFRQSPHLLHSGIDLLWGSTCSGHAVTPVYAKTVMLVLLAIAAATSRRAEFGSFCYNLFLVFTLALVAVPFLGFGSSASVVLATVVLAMCLLVACVILTRISFKSGADLIRVFGIGYGATIFGCSLGSTFGQTLFEASMPIASVSTISSVLVLVIVATAFFLLPRKHMIELMQPMEIGELDAIGSDDTPALETANDAPVVLDDEHLHPRCPPDALNCAYEYNGVLQRARIADNASRMGCARTLGPVADDQRPQPYGAARDARDVRSRRAS